MGANLKEVRERISSVNSTQQITKAMKMVSAAKLRRAQEAIQQMRPYARKLNEMMANILSNLDGDASSAYGESREIKRVLVVIVTSSRGLCGAFNANIIKEANALIAQKYPEQAKAGQVRIIPVGKKGYDAYRKVHPPHVIDKNYVSLFDDLSFDNVSKLSSYMIRAFLDGDYDAIEVVYGRFKNAAQQFPVATQWLPVEKIEAEGGSGSSEMRADYIFEPQKEALLEKLIPSILQTTFQSYLLDNHASEHGARMTAMDKATDNANELMKELRITYNKARQEAITKEISEIVGGAAALES